jgi:hypothetical protein
MNLPGLVLGLLDTSSEIGSAQAAEKYRGFTISWSRYGYQDVIIERDDVDQLLRAAADGGYRYCFLQSYGCILAERWRLEDQTHRDFFSSLAAWVAAHDFFAAGLLVTRAGEWYGFDPACLLVDLQAYRRLDTPLFHMTAEAEIELPGARAVRREGHLAALVPADGSQLQRPTLWGWNFIRASLQAQMPVTAFSPDLQRHILNLEATHPTRGAALVPYFDQGISRYVPGDEHADLTADQRVFLDVVSTQTANARQGVFLWNIESYADVEQPRDDFQPPVSTLYSVAAGFKPNRILQTHGFTPDTRVVYFDYSPAALDVKRSIVEQWDGDDFPDFVQHLFQQFPHPQTFYQLWDQLTPDQLDRDDIDAVWQRELSRWGGREALRDHWQQYARLNHEYVCCNLLDDPAPLLDRMRKEPSAIVWWSNAFFTMYGNWFFTIDHRQRAYDHWIEQLAAANPRLYLFGSDYNNANVNFIQAAEYWDQYRRAGRDYLSPCKFSRTEIRM